MSGLPRARTPGAGPGGGGGAWFRLGVLWAGLRVHFRRTAARGGGGAPAQGRGPGGAGSGPVSGRGRAVQDPTRGQMEAGGAADSLLSGACVLFTLAMYSTGL